MFEQDSLQNNHLTTYLPFDKSINNTLDNSRDKDISLRKKLHHLMTQNFQLKENITSLHIQLKTSTQIQQDLKNQLRIALQEININDQVIEQSKLSLQELQQRNKQLEYQMKISRDMLDGQKEVVTNLLEHNHNLQIQAKLMSEIKQKYQMESTKFKIQVEHFKNQIDRLLQQNGQLSCQISKMLQQIDALEQQVTVRRTQMQEYQTFVLSKISQARNDPQLHEKCIDQRDRWYCKYLKYKEKSRLLRCQRDELISHLSMVDAEVGSKSMRQYVQ